MTITEFLTARLDEEAAVWRQADAEGLLLEVPGAPVVRADGMTPRRFLADIAAKRAIEAAVARNPHASRDAYAIGREDVGRQVLLALVQPYVEHPDFDPAWRV